MQQPFLSVIIPVYKVEQYIAATLESILSQHFKDFEILLINDGSPDRSGQICDEYAAKDSRIRVFHKQNGGVSSARNMGLDNAAGQWITFVDADDTLAENAFTEIIKSIEYGDCDIVCFTSYYTKQESNGEIKVVKDFVAKETIEAKKIVENLLLWLHPTDPVVWNKVYKKGIIGSCRFDPAVKIGEDILFQTNILLSNNSCVTRINESPVYYYYVRGSGAVYSTRNSSIRLLSDKMEEILQFHKSFEQYESSFYFFSLVNIYNDLLWKNKGLSKEEYKDLEHLIKKAFKYKKGFNFKFNIFSTLYYTSRHLGNVLMLIRKYTKK